MSLSPWIDRKKSRSFSSSSTSSIVRGRLPGKIEDARALHVAVDAEADHAAHYRAAGDPLLARVLDDRVVKRTVKPVVAFGLLVCVDAHDRAMSLQRAYHWPLSWLRKAPATEPSQTPARQKTTEMSTLAEARVMSPSRANARV